MSKLKSYTVRMVEGEIWHTEVNAASEAEALEKAWDAYETNSYDDFWFMDSMLDGFQIIGSREVDK